MGYCDLDQMLTYRLDKKAALILASAVLCPAPSPANATGAAGDACPTATTEHVAKLPKGEVAALARSLAAERKAVPAAGAGALPLKSPGGPGDGHRSEERRRTSQAPHAGASFAAGVRGGAGFSPQRR